MSKLDQFVDQTKRYLGEDHKERILTEKFDTQIKPILSEIREKIGVVNNLTYKASFVGRVKTIPIEEVTFILELIRAKNIIEVRKSNHGVSTKLDEIILKDEELFCVEKEQNFNEDLLIDYLNESFGKIIGLA